MDGLQLGLLGLVVLVQQVLADVDELAHANDALVNLILGEGSVGGGGGVQMVQFSGQENVQVEGIDDVDVGHGVLRFWGSIIPLVDPARRKGNAVFLWHLPGTSLLGGLLRLDDGSEDADARPDGRAE